MSKKDTQNQLESEKLFPDEEFIVQAMEMPEPNFEARGKKVTATITGNEKICLDCNLPLSLCNYGGEHYNNDTF